MPYGAPLAFDPRWVDQVTRRLRRDQQIAQSAIGSGLLDGKPNKTPKDFIREAGEAITRMGNESEQAMAWAEPNTPATPRSSAKHWRRWLSPSMTTAPDDR